ncbi:single-stranded DNA-binding protein [Campylobacter iguaniorum]|jgi:single-strand DNA-binding protein|nr:single-stranded DNA-binding protein [Campylobacter iguaniorum]
MYNTVIMVGNLTRDIELRYAQSGAAIAKSAIATSYKYKTQNGEQKEEVCYLDFNIFGRSAEVANQYLRKGSKVLLEGRLVFEQWTAQDGSNRSKHSLRVENMKMLDTQQGSNTQEQNQGYGSVPQNQGSYNQPQNGGYNNNYPQQKQYQQQQPRQAQVPQNNIPEIDIDEDEIPF